MLVSKGDWVDGSDHWSVQEIDEAAFKDVRLGRHCAELVKRLSAGMGGSIPSACQD
jgi:Transposase DNA-binding